MGLFYNPGPTGSVINKTSGLYLPAMFMTLRFKRYFRGFHKVQLLRAQYGMSLKQLVSYLVKDPNLDLKPAKELP